MLKNFFFFVFCKNKQCHYLILFTGFFPEHQDCYGEMLFDSEGYYYYFFEDKLLGVIEI